METGKLIIISAPSGSGKSTIINEIIKDESLRLSFSISATTRPIRRGEQDGVNYYFMTPEEFKAAIAADEFAEYQEVYEGRFYGTLKREIERINAEGRNVVLDIDVLGGINVKQMYGDRFIFTDGPVLTPGMDEATQDAAIADFFTNSRDQMLVFENAINTKNVLTLELYTYKQGLQHMDYSYATAIGILMSIVSITLLFVTNWIAKRVRGSSIV